MTPTRSRWPLTLALCGGYFLVLLDVTVVNVALPRIGAELQADAAGLAWSVDAYSVPLAALLLVSGAIGDRLGHRLVVLLGMACFGAASAACALAPGIGVLIAARVVQGIGAALMLPGTLALLVESGSDEASRSRLVGIWASIGGAALPAGPLVGGLLVQSAGWRAVFWLSVPLIAGAIVPVARLPRPAPAPGRGGVDAVGAGLLMIGLACLVTAVIRAPEAPLAAGVLAAAAVGALLGLAVVERHAARPVLAVPRAARRPLGLASLVAGLMNLCALGGLFLLTQVLQDVHGLSPLAAGLLTLPAMLPLPLLGAPAGRLAARIGLWRTGALGAATAAAGMAGIAATLPDAGAGAVPLALSLALWGSGLGVLTPAIVGAAMKAMPESPGLASGASNTARQAGGALGIAAFAAIAGPAHAAGFAARTSGVLLGGTAVLVLAAVLCIAAPRQEKAPS